MSERVVHKITYEIASKFKTTRIYINCKLEPLGVFSNLLFVKNNKLVTCKRCKAKMKKNPSPKKDESK